MKDHKQRRTFVLTRHPPPYTSTLAQVIQRSIQEEKVRETHVERTRMLSGDASIPAGWGKKKRIHRDIRPNGMIQPMTMDGMERMMMKQQQQQQLLLDKEGGVSVGREIGSNMMTGGPAPAFSSRITPFGRPAVHHPKVSLSPQNLSTSSASGSIIHVGHDKEKEEEGNIVRDKVRTVHQKMSSSKGMSLPLTVIPTKRQHLAAEVVEVVSATTVTQEEHDDKSDENRVKDKKLCTTLTSASRKKEKRVSGVNVSARAQTDLRSFMLRK